MITILRTSFIEDSTESKVPVFSRILSWRTRGITTVPEVKPIMAPKMNAGRISRSVSHIASPATTNIVEKKLIGARIIALLIAERSMLNLRARPLSKRMIIRVTVVKTGPTAPNRAGEASPSTGPAQMPMIISRMTSGIWYS